MTTTETLERCKVALAGHYGSRLRGLVLYGSMARRRPVPGSDIDILVLLSPPFDYFKELRQIVDLLYPIQLDTDRLLSVKPAVLDEYEEGRIQLYRNARRQGVTL